jgi:hypothetical protein
LARNNHDARCVWEEEVRFTNGAALMKCGRSEEGSEIQTKTDGNALEAECYSKPPSAALSLFPISITSLYIEWETGIEPATFLVNEFHEFVAVLDQVIC